MSSNRRHATRLTAVQLRRSSNLSPSWVERENVRLVQENQRLRQDCEDLTASAELWIRLYEAALLRAKDRGYR